MLAKKIFLISLLYILLKSILNIRFLEANNMFNCSKCKEPIYIKTDGIFMLGRKFHRKCWKCDVCEKPLEYKCCEISGQIYCNECQLSTFGPREIGYFMTKWNKETSEKKLKTEMSQKDQLLFL